ncbi:hypothetical protein ACTFIV_006153 [Dictyostelium citrinum]
MLDDNDFSKYQQRYELQNQNIEIISSPLQHIRSQQINDGVQMSGSIQSDLSSSDHFTSSGGFGGSSSNTSNRNSDNSTQRPLMVDIGLEYKYRLALEQNPNDFKALVKWGSLIYKNIKNQMGGKHVDVCLMDWNEELIPIPQNNNNHHHHNHHNHTSGNFTGNINTNTTLSNSFFETLNSINLREPLFDVCGKYQSSLQLSGGSGLLNIPFSTLLNYNLNEQLNILVNNLNNSSSTNTTTTTTTTKTTTTKNLNDSSNNINNSRILRSVSLPPAPPPPPTEDPNSPWSDPILWMKWGDCLFLLCTYLELPMYRATCEKYFKCIQILFKQQEKQYQQQQQQQDKEKLEKQNNYNIKLLAIVLRKWGITLSRYSRRMKSQFLMSEWSSDENIQVEELWKVLHSQSIQSLLISNKISPSLVTQYHLATAYHRHAITLNQFGCQPKEEIYGLITNSCKIYYETLLESLSDQQLQFQQQQQPWYDIEYYNHNEIFNDQFKSKSLENWGRALDVQLSTKLNDEEETIEKEEEDLNSVDEYLTTFSKAILKGVSPSLEGVVSLCLNSKQALQYKAINSISVLCRSSEILKSPIYNELMDQMTKVESFVSKRDDAESLLSQQKTLKSMPPKLQAYVRMSGLGEEEIMKNFEIAWNSIYFLTKDTIPNQPIPPNYYRSNKKNKLKQRQLNDSNNQDEKEEPEEIKPPLLPSIHRTNQLNNNNSNNNNNNNLNNSNNNGNSGGETPSPSSSFIITPFTSSSHSKFNTQRQFLSNSTLFNLSGSGIFSNNHSGSIITTTTNNSSISPTKSNGWTLTLPSKAPTRRATVSLININDLINQQKQQQQNQTNSVSTSPQNSTILNNNSNNNNLDNKPISKFIPSTIIRTTVNPPLLSRCDETIFSSGTPLPLFRDKIKLGTGAFGNVFYAIRKSDSSPVAIKVLMERTKKDSPIIPELYIHSACSHPNIVTYIESYLCKGHVWIILEYCDGGTVRDLLQATCTPGNPNNLQLFEETLIAYIITELLEGLVYLRSKGIIHRDLKSRNILLTRKGKVKIADFGLATTCSLGRGRTRMCGTMGRIAPEVIRREPYDTQSDIYSLGCLIIEMAEGTVPYGKDSSLKALFYTAIHQYKLPNPKKYTKEFVDFLYLCLNPDPFKRPTPEMLLHHTFLSGADRGKSLLLGRFKNQDTRKNLLLDNFVAF